jgi:signal peptidase I
MVQRAHILTIMLAAVLWLVFAPVQLGGRAAYVVVNGNSMEPLYHRGDLVITRAANAYAPGDIVTYRHPQVGPVIHRIIGRAGERWVFKGDNNDFVDHYRPLQSEFIGRSWLHLPGAGAWLVQARAPLVAALALGLGWLAMSGTKPSRRSKRRLVPARPLPALREPLALGCVLAGLAGLLLTLLAFTQPLTRETSDELTYRQTGRFSYTAGAPAGLYDAPEARTGDPVFRALAERIDVGFSYRFESDAPAEIHGSYSLHAELSAPNGWRRTIELQPRREFRGRQFSAAGVLEFAQLQAMIDRLEAQTRLDDMQYTLAILPDVAFSGDLDRQPLAGTFAPRMVFLLDTVQLQLAANTGERPATLQPSQEGVLPITHSQPAMITLPGFALPVVTARLLGPALLLVALVGLAAAGLPLVRAIQRDEARRIGMKHGSLLATAALPPAAHAPGAIVLTSIADLARIAERQGAPILHEPQGASHHYAVRDGEQWYRYTLAPAEELLTPIEAEPETELEEAEASLEHWQQIFLTRLCETGLSSEACRAAGISMLAAYRERERQPAFAQAWREAQASSRSSAVRRSIPL